MLEQVGIHARRVGRDEGASLLQELTGALGDELAVVDAADSGLQGAPDVSVVVDVDGNGRVEASSVAVIDGLLDLNGDGFITIDDDGTFGGVTVVDGVITDTQFSS